MRKFKVKKDVVCKCNKCRKWIDDVYTEYMGKYLCAKCKSEMSREEFNSWLRKVRGKKNEDIINTVGASILIFMLRNRRFE